MKTINTNINIEKVEYSEKIQTDPLGTLDTQK